MHSSSLVGTTLRTLPLLLSAASLVACGGTSRDASGAAASTTATAPIAVVAPSSTAPTASAAAPTVQHFKRQTKRRLPNGNEVSVTSAFLKRTVDPANGVVVEAVLEVPRRDEKAKELVITMKVEGDHFTLSEASKSLEGAGTLVGGAWHWTGWTSHARLADGTTVDATDTLTSTGLTSEKTIQDASGKTVKTVTETYVSITPDAYEALRASVLSTVIGIDPTVRPGGKAP